MRFFLKYIRVMYANFFIYEIEISYFALEICQQNNTERLLRETIYWKKLKAYQEKLQQQQQNNVTLNVSGSPLQSQ